MPDPRLSPAVAEPFATAQPADRESLLTSLREGNDQTAEAAIAALFARGTPPDYRAVADYFLSLPPGRRRNDTAGTLQRSIDRAAALALIDPALGANDDQLKELVRDSLAVHADAELLQQLVNRFDTASDEKARAFFAGTVNEVRNPETIDALMLLAEGMSVKGRNEDAMGWAAVRALVGIGSAPATLALYSIMDRTGDAGIREALGGALSTIHSPEAIPALQAAARGGKDARRIETRVAATLALAQQDREQALIALQELAKSQDASVREAAAAGLRNLQGKRKR